MKTIRVIPRPLHQLADDKEYASRFSRMLKSMPRQHGSQIMGGGLSGFNEDGDFRRALAMLLDLKLPVVDGNSN